MCSLLPRSSLPERDSPVKFVLIKRDLAQLGHGDILDIAHAIKSHDRVRSDELDIGSYAVADAWEQEPNLMWFIVGVNFASRDVLIWYLH